MKNMFKKLWFVLAVLLLASLACSFSASTAKVSDVYLAHDEQGNDSTSFFAQDEVFYCFVTLANAPDDTALKAMWKTVNVEGEQAGLILDDVELMAGSGKHQFSISNQNLWPLGVYAVEIYLNNELQQTLEFRVE